MGDFWQNLNKGIDQIVPFALKKQDLDNERARLAAQMQRLDQHNTLIGEQVNEMRRKREMREGLTATLQELIGKGVPGKETVSVQDLIPGDTGDVDRGFSTTGIAPLRTEEREVRRQPTAEELYRAVLPYTDPAQALTQMVSLEKQAEMERSRDTRQRLIEDERMRRELLKDQRRAEEMDLRERLADKRMARAVGSVAGKPTEFDKLYNEYRGEILAKGQQPMNRYQFKIWMDKQSAGERAGAVADVKAENDPVYQLLGDLAGKGGAKGGGKRVKYGSPDDVKAAYTAGRIDRNQATAILRDQFGMQ